MLLKQCPGAFMLPGAGEDRAALDTPGYACRDAAVPRGIAGWLSLLREEPRRRSSHSVEE